MISKRTYREKSLIVNEEPAILPTIAKTAYLSSNEFCKLTSELFKGVFADSEGCFFEAGNGEPTISLLFNHGQYDKDAVVACELLGGQASGSSIIDRTRNRDRQMMDGDRYYLTEDGKDACKSLLIPRLYNNGNPNWRSIVGEWSDNSVVNFYNMGQRPQYTKVSGISLSRLCGLLFGNKDENGEYVEYDVRIATALTPAGYPQNGMNMNVNYMLSITVVSSAEVAKIYEKLGYGTVGAHIIRA